MPAASLVHPVILHPPVRDLSLTSSQFWNPDPRCFYQLATSVLLPPLVPRTPTLVDRLQVPVPLPMAPTVKLLVPTLPVAVSVPPVTLSTTVNVSILNLRLRPAARSRIPVLLPPARRQAAKAASVPSLVTPATPKAPTAPLVSTLLPTPRTVDPLVKRARSPQTAVHPVLLAPVSLRVTVVSS